MEKEFLKVTARLLETPTNYYYERRACLDGTAQLYVYDRHQTEFELNVDKIEKEIGSYSYKLYPEIKEKKLLLVVFVRRTSYHWYEVTALLPLRTETQSFQTMQKINEYLIQLYRMI